MTGITTSPVGVFWDYENCRPPLNLSGHKLADNIKRLVQGCAPVKVFKAYVDISLECTIHSSVVLHSEFQSSGVTLVHCPHNGKKDVADKMMIVDMLAFAMDHPPPVTIALITGDRDFAYAAAVLKLRGHRIIVIAPTCGNPDLKMQADVLFDWQRDVTGTDVPTGASDRETKRDEQRAQQRSEPRSKPVDHPVTLIDHSNNSPSRDSTVIGAKVSRISEAPQSSRKSPSPRAVGPNEIDSSRTSASIRRTTSCPKHSSTSTSVVASRTSTTDLFDGASVSDVLEFYSDSGDDSCACTICTRSSGVVRSCHRATTQKPENPIPQRPPNVLPENRFDVNVTSTTDTPSSVSSVLSSTTNATSPPSFASPSQQATQIPTAASIARFGALIEYFRDQQGPNNTARIDSSTVATAMLARAKNVYEKAGVRRMKQYAEEAERANVIRPTKFDSQGKCWIVLNPVLYSSALPAPKIVIAPHFKPLVKCLQGQSPTFGMTYAEVGMYFKNKYPKLYKQAGFKSLTKYLEKAEDDGIVSLSNARNHQGVVLVPALRTG